MNKIRNRLKKLSEMQEIQQLENEVTKVENEGDIGIKDEINEIDNLTNELNKLWDELEEITKEINQEKTSNKIQKRIITESLIKNNGLIDKIKNMFDNKINENKQAGYDEYMKKLKEIEEKTNKTINLINEKTKKIQEYNNNYLKTI